MMMNNIKQFDSAQATAQALASHISKEISDKEIFHLAISGGSTPKMLFEALVDIKEEINWQKLHLYWVDERCVRPTHEESNYLMTKLSLLDNVDLPEGNIHRMKGELSTRLLLEQYLRTINKMPRHNKGPQFDLIILGMGDDGHTASIFPTQMGLITIDNDLAIGTNPYSGQERLTLTGKTIRNAKAVIFHVTGEKKSAILNEILNETGNYKTYPASYFNNPETLWYVDNAAMEI